MTPLTEAQRRLINGQLHEGYNPTEIAERYGLDPKAVQAYLARRDAAEKRESAQAMLRQGRPAALVAAIVGLDVRKVEALDKAIHSPPARLERRPAECSRACSGKPHAGLAFYAEVLGGSVAHHRCNHCAGLTLVATGAEVVKRLKTQERHEVSPPKRPPKAPDPDTADVTELCGWLEGQVLALQRHRSAEAYMLIGAVGVVLAGRGRHSMAGELKEWEGELREAARAVAQFTQVAHFPNP